MTWSSENTCASQIQQITQCLNINDNDNISNYVVSSDVFYHDIDEISDLQWYDSNVCSANDGTSNDALYTRRWLNDNRSSFIK